MAAAITDSGLPADRVQEFLIAIAEVVASVLKHAGDPAHLALWVAGEVHDDGPGVDDPFAGYLPPQQGRLQGHGPLDRPATL